MSTSTLAPDTGTAGATNRTAVIAAALVGAVASAGYVSGVVFSSGMSDAEAQRAPLTVVESLLTGGAYVVLAITLTGLAAGSRLPRWPLALSAAACAFVAIQAWTVGTVFAWLATELPEAQLDAVGQDTFLFGLFIYPMGVLCLAGYTALAIVGWRRGAFSRGASVVLVLAGLAALLGPFPPTGLLGAIGIAWLARTLKSR
ncbi:hypothetical protein ACTMTJ_19030 [Phytohabitans sp. LJ34]|uniref:hypothetical protein n=1 Tax=Phytohabitans sp. LJ34 TaxID=3452217 RepID=UPI003F8CB13B